MQTSAHELFLILPGLITRTLGYLGWKDSTGVGKLGRSQVGLGKHEMKDSERLRVGQRVVTEEAPSCLLGCVLVGSLSRVEFGQYVRGREGEGMDSCLPPNGSSLRTSGCSQIF